MERQKGFTVIELTITLTIAALLSMHFYSQYFRDVLQIDAAREAGHHWQQYHFAVQRRLSQEGVGVLGGAAGPLAFSGDEWLKNGCTAGYGTAPEPYMDCAFNPVNPWGDTYEVTVLEPVPGRVSAEIRIEGPKPAASGPVGSATISDVEPRLLAVMRNTAASIKTGSSPIASMFTNFSTDDTDASGWDDTGVSVASTTLAVDDLWLRVDGANEMQADADIGGFDVVDVDNLDSISITSERGDFSDFIRVPGGEWGSTGGLANGWSGSANVLDADQTDVRFVNGGQFEVEANNLIRLQVPDAAFAAAPNVLTMLTTDGSGNNAGMRMQNNETSFYSGSGGNETTFNIDASNSSVAILRSDNPSVGANGEPGEFIQFGQETAISIQNDGFGSVITNEGILREYTTAGGTTIAPALRFAEAGGSATNLVQLTRPVGTNDIRVSTPDTNTLATLVSDLVYEPTLNRYLDQAVFDKTVVLYTGTEIEIPKPICKSLNGTALRSPQIFTSYSGGYHNSGEPAIAHNIRVRNIGSAWGVAGEIRVQSTTNISDIVMRIVVERKCT